MNHKNVVPRRHTPAVDTDALRAAGWQPAEPLPCGCTPELLCAPHGWLRDAEQWERYVGEDS